MVSIIICFLLFQKAIIYYNKLANSKEYSGLSKIDRKTPTLIVQKTILDYEIEHNIVQSFYSFTGIEDKPSVCLFGSQELVSTFFFP